jgi:hypothetical protein
MAKTWRNYAKSGLAGLLLGASAFLGGCERENSPVQVAKNPATQTQQSTTNSPLSTEDAKYDFHKKLNQIQINLETRKKEPFTYNSCGEGVGYAFPVTCGNKKLISEIICTEHNSDSNNIDALAYYLDYENGKGEQLYVEVYPENPKGSNVDVYFYRNDRRGVKHLLKLEEEVKRDAREIGKLLLDASYTNSSLPTLTKREWQKKCNHRSYDFSKTPTNEEMNKARELIKNSLKNLKAQ